MAILERVTAYSEGAIPFIKKSLRDKYGKEIDITVEIKDISYSTVEYSWREGSQYISDKSSKSIQVIAEDDSPEPEPKPRKSLEDMIRDLKFKRTSTAT